MKKLLIFHPALAPYRVDHFNELSQLFDLEVIFVSNNVWNHNFDQGKLLQLLNFKYSFLLNGPFYKGRVFRFGMLKSIKRIKPDIIIGFEYSFTTQYLILLKRLGLIKQKIGSTIDDSIEICHHVQSKVRYITRNQSVKKLDYLIVLSNEVSRYYQNSFNIKDSKIIVAPFLQSAERLRNKTAELECIAKKRLSQYHLNGKKVLLFIGRFIPEKALTIFIKTIQSLLIEHENFVLVLVGDGEERTSIELLIKETHLGEKIFLPGRFEGNELYAWYLCASGFVLPSTNELFGAVANEALIFGLKVFCSKYAGFSGLVKENGILFDPLNKNDTVEKLEKFLSLIETIKEINMSNKPSLMSNNQAVFINEWSKLNHDELLQFNKKVEKISKMN